MTRNGVKWPTKFTEYPHGGRMTREVDGPTGPSHVCLKEIHDTVILLPFRVVGYLKFKESYKVNERWEKRGGDGENNGSDLTWVEVNEHQKTLPKD